MTSSWSDRVSQDRNYRRLTRNVRASHAENFGAREDGAPRNLINHIVALGASSPRQRNRAIVFVHRAENDMVDIDEQQFDRAGSRGARRSVDLAGGAPLPEPCLEQRLRRIDLAGIMPVQRLPRHARQFAVAEMVGTDRDTLVIKLSARLSH